jgi:hypothetical protein
MELSSQEPDSNPNVCLICNARTGSLLAYCAIWARLRDRESTERDIGERDIRETNIRKRAIRENVGSCRFAE